MTSQCKIVNSIQALLVLGLMSICLPVQAQYGGGSGTEADPYLIFTAEQLNQIGLNDSDLDEHFLLMADINLSAFQKQEFNIIGRDEDHPFEGVFDGNGFRILNFSYKASPQHYVGLFGVVGESDGNDAGLILNLGMVDVNVDGGEGFSTGGLVGFLAKGQIENCYVRNGTVRNDSHFSGGLVGASYGLISASYTDVRVIGAYEVGGIAGLLGEPGTVVNCYTHGRVSGFQYVGGLVGDMREETRIEHCYATGNIAGQLDDGALVGINDGEIVNCFWDYQSSAIMYMCGGGGGGTGCTGDGGKTTAEMQLEDTFDDEGWDFDTPIWKIKEGEEPPRLWWEVANPVTFLFALDGEQVVGLVDTPATAIGIVRYDQENSEISWNIIYSPLHQDPNTEITSAYLRGPAEPNQVGDIQIDILANSVSVEELVNLTPMDLSEQQVEDLLSGLWYVEIGTVRNPAGEIRGQVVKKYDIQVDSVTIKAGKSRTEPADSFKAGGNLYLSTDDAAVEDLIYAETIEVQLVNMGGATEELDTILLDVVPVDVNPGKLASSGVFSYKRPKGGSGLIKTLKIDFNKNTFTLDAQKVDLSGLRMPFKLTIDFGAYQGTILFSETNAEKVNKGKPLPICLLSAVEDALRADKAKVKTSKKGDSLTAQGGIAAGEISLDLNQETVTIEWGDFSETLIAGSLVAKKGRNYSYKKPKNGPELMSSLSIDLDKCSFKLTLKEAPELAKEGTVVLKIHSETFQAEDEVVF
jgi:CHRD domain-containing protein/GLUG motif-containing protein